MPTSLFDLAGKVAIVTGSGRGLGRAIANGLSRAGARVVVCGRTGSILGETVAEIRGAGGEAVAITFDAVRREDCQRLVRETVERFGGLDVMVVNHGIGRARPAEQVEESEWDEMIEINLKGAFNC